MKLIISALLVGVCGIVVASCNSTHKPSGNTATPTTSQITLAGSEWVLVDLAGAPVLPNVKATLAFPEAGRVAGNGSCNRFTGGVTITRENLKMGALASTRMACMDNQVSEQEDKYLKALGQATRYAYQEPYLLIYAEGYDKPLRFTKAPAGQL